MKEISIGNITTRPGTKEFGYFDVPGVAVERSFDCRSLIGPARPRTMRIPVMVVNGSSPGPKLGIAAGVHASETALTFNFFKTLSVDVGDLNLNSFGAGCPVLPKTYSKLASVKSPVLSRLVAFLLRALNSRSMIKSPRRKITSQVLKDAKD